MNSVVSQSKSSAESFVYKGNSNSGNLLFALFDQITQNTELPKTLICICYLFVTFQFLDINMWDITPADKYAFFNDGTVDDSALCILYAITALMTVFALVFPVLLYKYIGKFYKWTLYYARFCFEIIIPIFIGPVAWEFGLLFINSEMENSALRYTLIVILIIIYLFYLIFYYISQTLLCKTAYMTTSPIHGFTPYPLILVFMVHNVILFLEALFLLLPKWTFYVICVFHFCLEAYGIYVSFQLYYFQHWVNAFFAGIFTTSLVADIMWMAKVYWLYRTIIMYLCFATFIIMYQFIFRLRVNKIKKLLSVVDFGPENAAQQCFDYLRSINTDSHFMEYINVGLVYHCPLFVNFQLFRYAIEHERSSDILTICLKAIVLFPTESSTLNIFFKTLDRNIKLSFSEKFMLYQINKIKLLRQSSSSIAAAAKLEEMRVMSRLIKSRVSAFWRNKKPTIASLVRLKQDMDLCSTKWEEAIRNFPNSIHHRDEYVKYLIDGVTDFQEACKQHCISGLLESGRNFSVDYCFRSLIYLCPEYIKKKIVDIHGKLHKEGTKKGSSSTNSSKNVSDTFTSELDPRMEETVAKDILKQHKLRLALQNALKSRKSNHIKKVIICTIVNFIASISMFTALFLVYKSFFNEKFIINNRNMIINEFQLGTMLAGTYNIAMWANLTDRLDPLTLVAASEPIHYKPTWNLEDFGYCIGNKSYYSRQMFTYAIRSMSKLAVNGVDVYKFTKVLLNDEINMTSCANGEPAEPEVNNLQSYYFQISSSFLLSHTIQPYEDWWTNNEYFCRGYVSLNAFEDAVEIMRNTIVDTEFVEYNEERRVLEWIQIFIPVGYIVIFLLPFLLFFGLTLREIANLIKMMMEISEEFKREGAGSIQKQTNHDQQNNDQEQTGTDVEPKESNALFVFSSIMVILLTIAEVTLVAFIMDQCVDLHMKFKFMNHWEHMNSIQEPLALDIIIHVMEAIFINGTGPKRVTQRMMTIDEIQKRVKDKLDLLNDYRSQLVSGIKGVRSILGFDKNIGSLLYLPNCIVKSDDSSTVHDQYACGSITQQLTFFDNLVTDLMAKVSKHEATMNNFIAKDIWHIIFGHAIPQLELLDNTLVGIMHDFVDEYENNFVVKYIVGLVLSFVALVCYIILIRVMTKPYEAAIILLRKIPAHGIVNNTKLLDYLLDKNSDKLKSEMNTTRSVIHNWSDAIFLLSQSGTIDSVNLAVTKILGYTPEQLLGRPLVSLFKDSDKEKIMHQLQLMISKQSPPVYDDHFTCYSDIEVSVPCLTMIFGMSEEGSQKGDINSFVVTLRDETALLEKQDIAEQAKKQSEDLLFQILPRDIVIRLNQGEKDISFEVKSASIMFIDFVKFSDFSSNLTPSQIMGTLSTLFGGYDENLSKYPLITKIKLIGDVYMCASGLFTPQEPPQNHAEQLIRFGLDALSLVEEMNIKYSTSLSVRIGMNSGGPLITGVLGSDKPVFDIIGDPINIASRLQSTDIPGRIQISQASYELVTGLDFNIEPRGEVYLKGKGTTKSFLVCPNESIIGSFMSASAI